MNSRIRFINEYLPVYVDALILEWKDSGVIVEIEKVTKFIPFHMIREIEIKNYGKKQSVKRNRCSERID